MYAQILKFEPRPERETRNNIAEAMGALTYNMRKLGVSTYFASRREDKAYYVTARCMWNGKELEFEAMSALDYSRAQLRAMELLHGEVTKDIIFLPSHGDISA